MDANFSPINNATINEPNPEKIPFMNTIIYVFLSDNFFVKLFSNPQHKVAKSTRIDPNENDETSLKDRTKLAIVIKVIAIHIFLEISSLKINSAINEVHKI